MSHEKLRTAKGVIKLSKKKGNPKKVNSTLAWKALERAEGDRKRAYSECIRLSFQTTGRLSPGFDNADLQAFYDLNEVK